MEVVSPKNITDPEWSHSLDTVIDPTKYESLPAETGLKFERSKVMRHNTPFTLTDNCLSPRSSSVITIGAGVVNIGIRARVWSRFLLTTRSVTISRYLPGGVMLAFNAVLTSPSSQGALGALSTMALSGRSLTLPLSSSTPAK